MDSQHGILQWKISVNSTPDLTIFSDASKKGWVALCQGITTGCRWSSVEKAWHINVLELEAMRLAVLSFTKFKKLNSIHLRRDNMTDPSYLLKMGGTQNKHLIETAKEIRGYLIERKIHYSRIYTQSEQSNSRLGIPKLPGQSFRETIIGPVCFQNLTWRPDLQSVATDAFQQDWKYQFRYAFSPFQEGY